MIYGKAKELPVLWWRRKGKKRISKSAEGRPENGVCSMHKVSSEDPDVLPDGVSELE